jgi:hypothetical protein
MDPLGRTALDELQCLGDGESRGKREEDMYMVGHATNLNGLHLILSRDPAKKWPKSIAQLRRNERPAFFGAKDAMMV